MSVSEYVMSALKTRVPDTLSPETLTVAPGQSIMMSMVNAALSKQRRATL